MLEILYKLQKLEAEESALVSQQKNCEEYRLLRELKAEFEKLKQSLLQKQDQLLLLQENLNPLPGLLEEIEKRLEKEKAAVYDGSIGNIRELSARQNQIGVLEERKAALGAELMEKQAELRRIMHQAKLLQQRITEQHQHFTAKYRDYETLREGWQSQLNLLAGAKDELISGIEQQTLAWYEEQKPLFAGLPVAKLDSNHVCDGCRTIVTPILYKRTVLGERTRCEKCGRYLFIAEQTEDQP